MTRHSTSGLLPAGCGTTIDTGRCGQDCACPAPKCGDGIVNQASEQCDDGDTDSGDGCSATCETESPACGNDIRQGFEQCDGTDDATCSGACSSCECAVSPAWKSENVSRAAPSRVGLMNPDR